MSRILNRRFIAALSRVLCVSVALYASDGLAGPARFWVSPSPTDPFWSGLALSETLEIDLLADPQDVANSKAKLYIWAQPATVTPGVFKQLQNMTLDIISTDPLLDFIDEEMLIENPLNTAKRFSFIRDGATQNVDNPSFELTTKTPAEILGGESDEILGLQGLNLLVPVPSPAGVGIGPVCLDGDLCVQTSQGPAWRIGSFGVQSVGMVGDVAINLRIGAGGMNHLAETGDAIESTSSTNVIFAASSLSSPVYNAGPNPSGQRQTIDVNDAPEVLIHISDQLTGDYTENAVVDGADFLLWQRIFGTSASLPNRRIGHTGNVGASDLYAWEANFGPPVAEQNSLPGDFNDDGDVDGADFLRWQRGESPVPLSATDLAAWNANFGLPVASLANSISVPEPGTQWLGLAGAVLCLGLSRFRQKIRWQGLTLGIAILASTTGEVWSAQIDVSWLNAADGNWNDASNWDSVDFPNNSVDTFDVTIDATGSPYTVTLNSDVTIDNLAIDSTDATLSIGSGRSLVLEETANLLAGTLTLLGGTIMGGTVTQSGGSLQFSSRSVLDGVTVSGDLTLSNVSAQVILRNGTQLQDNAVLSGNSTVLAADTAITLDNTIDLTGSTSILGATSNGTLTFSPTAQVNLTGVSAQIGTDVLSGLFGDGEVINQGTITASGSGTKFISGDLFDNQGTVEVTSGTLSLNGNSSWTNTGVYQVQSGATLRINGDFSHTGTAQLTGTGTVDINANANTFINAAVIKPGNSPGILTIDGDYTQLSDGMLEIEIAGLTPGTQHDQLRVTGAATLGGRLDVPLIDGFVPVVGDEVVFLTAASVVGGFENYNFPNELPEDVAQQLAYSATDVRVQFIAPIPIDFVSDDVEAEWTTPTDWKENGLDATPDSVNILSVSNNLGTGQLQTVNLVAPAGSTEINAAHSLTVGDATDEITLSINDTKLSSTTTTTITANGAIEQSGDSVLSARILDVQGGGRFAGTGTVVGDVDVGMSGVGGAMIEPGIDGVGQLDVVGNYSQGTGGVFAIDIAGDNTGGNHDFVDVSGAVALNGKITIDASDLTGLEVTPGDVYEIIAAEGALTGEFDDAVTTGSEDIYFEITYSDGSGALALSEGLAAAAIASSSSVFATARSMGDANGDDVIDNIDAQAFATAILDFRLGYNFADETRASLITLRNAFNFTAGELFDTAIDLDDIPGFVEAFSQSNSVSMASAYESLAVAFAQAEANFSIPEPTSATLCVFAALLLVRRCRKVNR